MKYRAAAVGRRSLQDVTTKIRSFLRWLYMTERTSRDLSSTVIAPMLYAFESIPSALRSGDVEKILAATRQDCTQKGIRDYAILMLISKYGIRSGEIATLRLDDVDWRKEVIRIRHSKTGAISNLPLLPEVGEAMLKYLQDSRPKTSFRADIYSRPCPVSTLQMRVKPIPTRPASARSRQRDHYRQTRPPCFSSCTGGEHASRDGIREGHWGSAGPPRSGFNIGVSEAGDGGLACSGLGDSDWGEGMKTTSMSKGSTPENYVRDCACVVRCHLRFT